ncbi:MAG: hypothetical protein QM779_05705 [Propionicimonas sp.]|uniref:hypothetical protein n=1 Tax=Propionicimonas sp. TaxID=1955623 RepID=UPI003D0EE46A
MVTHLDRPPGHSTTAADNLADLASELQASVVGASRAVATMTEANATARRFEVVAEAIDAAALRYWRDLRSYDAIATIRAAACRGAADMRAWQVAVEQSERRCEAPVIGTVDAARAVWRELSPRRPGL